MTSVSTRQPVGPSFSATRIQVFSRLALHVWLRLTLGAVCLLIASIASAQTTRTWKGSVGTLWSSAQNWSPAGAPTNGDRLTFPFSLTSSASTNDLSGLSLGGITFLGYRYVVSGNSIVLTGPYSSLGENTLNLGIDVRASGVNLGGIPQNPDVFGGRIDINAPDITVAGARANAGIDVKTFGASISRTVSSGLIGTGPVTVRQDATFIGESSYSGTISAAGGLLHFSGVTMPAANISNARVYGNGTIGPVTASALQAGQLRTYTNYSEPISGTTGTLNTGSLVLKGTLTAYISGSAPGTAYSQVNVNGTVALVTIDNSLDTARLSLLVTGSFSPTFGQTFVLISNDGTDAVSGTFAGMPEGYIYEDALNGIRYKISYVGGDGNDVTATFVGGTKTWTGAANNLWSNPNNWQPVGMPTNGQKLIFPPRASTQALVNDIPGLIVGGMSISSSYRIDGNDIVLIGSIGASDAVLNFAIDIREKDVSVRGGLTATRKVTVNAKGVTLGGTFTGGVDVGAYDVTLNLTQISGGLTGTGNLSMTDLVEISGTGTFNGSFLATTAGSGGKTLNLKVAALPAARVQGAQIRLSGSGTIGGATVSSISPSQTYWNGSSIVQFDSAGSIDTGNLNLTSGVSEFRIKGFTAGVGYSQVNVTGTLTIDPNTTLLVYVDTNLALNTQQEFVLIENDGTDPINGSFKDLPEGTPFILNGTRFFISYKGGDGNDFALRATPTKAWTGAAGSLWSTPGNWSPPGAPTNGEVVTFLPNVAGSLTNNDINGLSLNGLILIGRNNTINGNSIALTGSYFSLGRNFLNLPIDLRSDAVLGGEYNPINDTKDVFGKVIDINFPNARISNARLQGGLNVHSNALNLFATVLSGGLVGTGPIAAGGILITATGSYSGTITGSGVLLGLANLPSAGLTTSTLGGSGTVGALTILREGPFRPSNENGSAIEATGALINSKDLELRGTTVFDLTGETTVAGRSHINVAGTVTITDTAALTVDYFSGANVVTGQKIVLIRNDGTDRVVGIFPDLPEGSIIEVANIKFSLSYVGGDGNDVELTVLPGNLPAVELSASANPAPVNQSLTLTAIVRRTLVGSTPTGRVRFYELLSSGVVSELGSASLVAGSASLTIDPLTLVRTSPSTTRNIRAQYLGDSTYLSATSLSYVLELTSAGSGPSIRIVSSKNPSAIGERVTFTATVTGPVFAPTGLVTFKLDGISIDSVELANGVASYSTSTLRLGNNDISAVYEGDTNNGRAVALLTGGQEVTQTGAAISLLPENLPNGTVGTQYAATALSAIGGSAPYSFALSSGALPSGLVLSPDGALYGVPTASGTYSFTVRASDTNGGIGQRTYSVTIANSTIPQLLPQQLSFANPGQRSVGTTLVLSATASSGLAVQFSSLTPAVCTVASNVATFIATGNCSLAADQLGNSVYAAALRVVQAFIVSAPTSQSDQTLTFANPGLQVVGSTLNLLAAASSGLPVVFTSLSTTVCTVSGSIATFVTAGNCSIAADQPGSASYRAATRVTQTWSVITGVPTAPRNLSCIPIAGGASCTFLPPASQGTGPVVSYFLSCDAATAGSGSTVTSSPATIGLREWPEAYTCIITATNSVGVGPASVRSSAFYPLPSPNIPATPSLNRVFPGQNQALVTFTGVESNPQYPMIFLRVVSSPENRQAGCSVPCNSVLINNLSNNVPYTFTALAISFEGPSIPSAPSAPIVTGTALSGYPAPIAQRGGGIDAYGSGKSQVLVQSTGTGSYLAGSLSGLQLTFAPVVQVPAGTRPIALGDFSSTRRSDFMYQDTTTADPSLVSVAKLPNGAFSSLRNLKRAWIAQAVGDMDGDGTSDVVFRYTGTDGRPDDTGVSYIWFMKNGAVEQVRKRGGAPLSWNLLGAADINGDFAADMVYISPTNQVRVLMSTPGRTCANLSAGSLPVGYQALKLADFQGNGRAAILAQHTVTKSVILYTLDARSVTLPAPTADPDDPNASCTASSKEVSTSMMNFPLAPSGDFYAVGDFNGDGYFDILWKQGTGALVLWQMGSSSAAPTIIPGIGIAPVGSTVIQP